MQSLFVVSLPRSLSTFVYQTAHQALHLQAPSWVEDGEILNVDRYRHYHGLRFDESAKFTTRARDSELFEQLLEFLDHVAITEGFVYKDVIQPFVLASWPGMETFRVLKIQRELTDIAYSMLRRGWFYPRFATTHAIPMVPGVLAVLRRITPFPHIGLLHRAFRRNFESAVLEGLARAERALETIPGVTVAYDSLVRDEMCLQQALMTLYPQLPVAPLKYIDERFAARRDAIARRRRTPYYQKLQARIEHIRGRVIAPS
jgi:hypothetical protein